MLQRQLLFQKRQTCSSYSKRTREAVGLPGNQAISETILRLKETEMDSDYLNKKRGVIGRIVKSPKIEEKAEQPNL